MSRFMISVSPEIQHELRKLARREHRSLKDQATQLIAEGLERRRSPHIGAGEIRLHVAVDGDRVSITPEVI